MWLKDLVEILWTEILPKELGCWRPSIEKDGSILNHCQYLSYLFFTLSWESWLCSMSRLYFWGPRASEASQNSFDSSCAKAELWLIIYNVSQVNSTLSLELVALRVFVFSENGRWVLVPTTSLSPWALRNAWSIPPPQKWTCPNCVLLDAACLPFRPSQSWRGQEPFEVVFVRSKWTKREGKEAGCAPLYIYVISHCLLSLQVHLLQEAWRL